MQQLTYTDTLRMEGVLAEARHILAEMAQVAQGVKVKVTLYPKNEQGPISYCYPVRVALYARKVLGASSPIPEATKVSLTIGRYTTAHQPTVDGYRAFVRALLAHNEACLRRHERGLTKLGYQKGGQYGE